LNLVRVIKVKRYVNVGLLTSHNLFKAVVKTNTQCTVHVARHSEKKKRNILKKIIS